MEGLFRRAVRRAGAQALQTAMAEVVDPGGNLRSQLGNGQLQLQSSQPRSPTFFNWGRTVDGHDVGLGTNFHDSQSNVQYAQCELFEPADLSDCIAVFASILFAIRQIILHLPSLLRLLSKLVCKLLGESELTTYLSNLSNSSAKQHEQWQLDLDLQRRLYESEQLYQHLLVNQDFQLQAQHYNTTELQLKLWFSQWALSLIHI